MKRAIEILIPKALQAIPEYLYKSEQERLVHKEYDGYAASLGAAIRTSGLIPALTFYTDVHKHSNENSQEARRFKLLQALAYVLDLEVGENKCVLLNKVLAEACGEGVLSNTVKIKSVNQDVIKQWENKIQEASVALKLALRNFTHTQ